MSEKIITTKRGIYGRVSVTLPLPMKTAMLDWAKTSGIKKAEFLRLALTTGFLVLSEGIPVEVVEEDGGADAERPKAAARTGGNAATPYTDRGVEFRRMNNK